MSDEKNGGSEGVVSYQEKETPQEKVKPGAVLPNRDNDYYVDICEIRGCLYGFDINMGRREIPVQTPTPLPDDPVLADLTLKMSPAHFKDLACLMMGQIHAYEMQFGKIECQFEILGVNIQRKPQYTGQPTPPVTPGSPSILN